MVQRNESMLTFESAAVQGVGNIIEKLTVSMSPAQLREGDGETDHGFGTEPSLPKITAPS